MSIPARATRGLRRCVVVAALALAACSRPDPTIILGSWRAEGLLLGSLKLPIGPDFEVTRNDLILKSPDGTVMQRVALAAIRAQGDTIELEFRDGFGAAVVFAVDTRDRIRFRVPLLGTEIPFRRT